MAEAPREHRAKLAEIRAVIQAAVPDATERFSYRMPGYAYDGYRYKGMFAWFGLQSGHLGLYLRPPTLERHRRELELYTKTKSAVHLPLDRAIPVRLVQKLVRASVRIMKEREPPRRDVAPARARATRARRGRPPAAAKARPPVR